MDGPPPPPAPPSPPFQQGGMGSSPPPGMGPGGPMPYGMPQNGAHMRPPGAFQGMPPAGGQMHQPHGAFGSGLPATTTPGKLPTMYFRMLFTVYEPQLGQERTWTDCRREQVHDSQDVLREMVKKKNKTGKYGAAYLKTFGKRMAGNKMLRLNEVVTKLNSTADPQLEWELAYLVLNIDEAVAKGGSKKKESFTRSMDVVFRRVPCIRSSRSFMPRAQAPMGQGFQQAHGGQPGHHQQMPHHQMPHHQMPPQQMPHQQMPHHQMPHHPGAPQHGGQMPPRPPQYGPPAGQGHPAMTPLGPGAGKGGHPAMTPLGPGALDDDDDDYEDDFDDDDYPPMDKKGAKNKFGGKAKDGKAGKGKGKGFGGEKLRGKGVPVVHQNNPKVYAYSDPSDGSDSDSLFGSALTDDTAPSLRVDMKDRLRRNSSGSRRSGGLREHRRRPSDHARRGSAAMLRPGQGMNSRRPGTAQYYPEESSGTAYGQRASQQQQQAQMHHQHQLNEQARQTQEHDVKIARLEGVMEGMRTMQINAGAGSVPPSPVSGRPGQLRIQGRRHSEYRDDRYRPHDGRDAGYGRREHDRRDAYYDDEPRRHDRGGYDRDHYDRPDRFGRVPSPRRPRSEYY